MTRRFAAASRARKSSAAVPARPKSGWPRLRGALPHALVGLAAAVLYLLGSFEGVEGALMDARFRLLRQPVPDTLVIVSVDGRSLREVGVWPWPRRLHADLLDRLIDAGAEEVGFDIAFNFPSNEEDDARLEQALKEAGGRVVLPVYEQFQRMDDGESTLIRMAPAERFLRHARLGSINISPGPRGRVRAVERARTFDDTEAPSFALRLSGGARAGEGPFHLDFGFDASSIPQVSYVDVLTGAFDPQLFAGKTVMVGATAVELADYLSVPVYSAIPGVMLQALAYHSLTEGRALHRTGPVLTLLAVLFAALLFSPRLESWSWRKGLIGVLFITAGSLGVAVAAQASAPVLVDTAPLVFTVLLSYLAALVRRVDEQALGILSARMDAQRRRNMMHAVIENNIDGIVTVDETGTIRSFNTAAQRMFGYRAEEMVGGRIGQVLSDGRFDFPQERGEAEEGGLIVDLTPARRELMGRTKIGIRFPVEILLSKAPANEQGETLSLLTLRDIRDRKRVEKLESAREEAERENKTKSDFLANMSHELRTPLNAIIGFSEILNRQLYGSLGDDRYREYAGDINSSATHLLDLISDILDISKADASKLELHELNVDTESIVAMVIRATAGLAQARRVLLHMDVAPNLPTISADETKLKQVLLNLISNALKFTEARGEVRVSARLDQDGNLVLEVADTGIGIAQENIEKVMAPFGQVETEWNRNIHGTGLGLPLSKRLIEAHGGSLSLTSEQGVGTRATIVLPKARLSTESGAEEKPETGKENDEAKLAHRHLQGQSGPLALVVKNSEVPSDRDESNLGGHLDDAAKEIQSEKEKRVVER